MSANELLAAIALLGVVAERFRAPYPAVLVLGGIALPRVMPPAGCAPRSAAGR
jgi:hypothetical protein